MSEAVLGVLAIVLCVAGAVSIIRWFALRLAVCNKKDERIYAVLLNDEADIQLQMLFDTLDWDTVLNNAKIYAIDGGLNSEMADYCRAVCENSRVTYIEKDKAESFKVLF